MKPLMDDSLYGISYKCLRECSKCGTSHWYDLNDTAHILCLDCGHQEPVED
jgi:DNA-directed RNA polymerase subunit RPC12/RpoP